MSRSYSGKGKNMTFRKGINSKTKNTITNIQSLFTHGIIGQGKTESNSHFYSVPYSSLLKFASQLKEDLNSFIKGLTLIHDYVRVNKLRTSSSELAH